MVNRLLALIVVPAALGLVGGIGRPPSLAVSLVLILASTPWVVVLGWQFFLVLRERLNYLLGFLGERFVGELLTPLIGQGFEIYHDVPFEDFNIDHALVGPLGVFAIETKTRRKPFSQSRGKEYRVEFDGSCLRWPWGPETKDVQQAANNARSLSQWLGGAVGDPVWVTPILTLPGWLVNRSVPQSTVQVFNPKEIIDFCTMKREPLAENLLKRIRHQLNEKCRLKIE